MWSDFSCVNEYARVDKIHSLSSRVLLCFSHHKSFMFRQRRPGLFVWKDWQVLTIQFVSFDLLLSFGFYVF